MPGRPISADSELDEIGERFDEYVHLVGRDWAPGGLGEEALRLRWELGAAGALAENRFVEASYRALRGSWRAFRGVRVPRENYERGLGAAAPLIPALERVTIAGVRRSHVPTLFELFRAVADVKPTRAKWVATSKILYFLLPDLVSPIDNAYTIPFLRRAGVRMPPGIELEALSETFGVLSRLARLAGGRRLRALSRDPRYATPIGMARVVDFAIAGYELSRPVSA